MFDSRISDQCRIGVSVTCCVSSSERPVRFRYAAPYLPVVQRLGLQILVLGIKVRILAGKPLRVGGQYLSQPHKLEEVGATPTSRDHFSNSAAANDGRSGASYASGKATPGSTPGAATMPR